MTSAELITLDGYQADKALADNLIAMFPESSPSPVLEANMEPILVVATAARASGDADLETAIDAANSTWYEAIKTALEASRDGRISDIANFVGTDDEA